MRHSYANILKTKLLYRLQLNLKLPIVFLIACSCILTLSFDLKECLDSHKVYPDVVEDIPDIKVEVSYGKKEVHYCTNLSIADVQNYPTVKWPAEMKSFYTLIMIDPDAPSEQIPYIKQACHWWVANIRGCDVATGQFIFNYIPPTPAFRKGSHAYVFIVYKQPDYIVYFEDPNIAENVTKADRFDVKSLARKYDLGKPYAVNMFHIIHPEFITGGASTTSNCTDSKIIEEALKKYKVIPDLIHEAPKHLVEVTYPNNVKVKIGEVLKPEVAQERPNIRWPVTPGKYYTIIFIDPDNPNPRKPKFKSYQHWVLTNIHELNLTTGEHVSRYMGPTPRETLDGIHRYVYLIYQQDEPTYFMAPYVKKKGDPMRRRFDLDAFVSEYDLEGPVAVNFFRVMPMYDKVTTTEVVTDYEMMPLPDKQTLSPDYEDD